MACLFRSIIAVVVGLASAFASAVAVEFWSDLVHPFPKDRIPPTMEDMCAHVARYPHWVLGVVVIVYSATAFASAFVAAKIGRRVSGFLVVLLLGCALVFNVAMLPYTLWFKIVMPTCFATAGYLGVLLGRRLKPPTEQDLAA